MIDSKNQEIRRESDDVYSKMDELADELPESSPRFILLSYPLAMVSILAEHPAPLPDCANDIRNPVDSLSRTSSSTSYRRTATRRYGCCTPGPWS